MIHCLCVTYHAMTIYIYFSKLHNNPAFNNITQDAVYFFKELRIIKKKTFHNEIINHTTKTWVIIKKLKSAELSSPGSKNLWIVSAWQLIRLIAKYCSSYERTIYCGFILQESNNPIRDSRVKSAKQWKQQHKEMSFKLLHCVRYSTDRTKMKDMEVGWSDGKAYWRRWGQSWAVRRW